MLGFLGDLLGLNQGDPLIEAAGQNRDVMREYDTRGQGIIEGGHANSRNHLMQLAGLYNPIAGSTQMLADATGLGGAAGSDRATAAFRTNPGYEFQRDQGIQAIDRSASARGSFQGGGAMADVMDYSQGLADQSYGGWLDRLNGMSNTALAGRGGAMTNLANLESNTAGMRLGHAGGVASGMMGANNQVASGETTNKQGIANMGSALGSIAGRMFGFGGF